MGGPAGGEAEPGHPNAKERFRSLPMPETEKTAAPAAPELISPDSEEQDQPFDPEEYERLRDRRNDAAT